MQPEKVRLGPALLGVSRIWAHLVNALVMLAATQWVEPSAFGSFMIALSGQAALGVFVGQGIYEYVVKAEDNPKTIGTAFALTLSGAGLACVASVILSFGLSAMLHQALVGELLRALAALYFVTAANLMMESVQLRHGRLGSVGATTMVADLAGLCAAMVGLWQDMGIYALVLHKAVREVLLVAGYAMLGECRLTLALDRSTARQMLNFARPLVATRVVGNAGQLAVDALMGALLSVAAVGIFRLAHRIVMLGWDIMFQPLRASLWSSLARIGSDGTAFGRLVLAQTEAFGLGLFALQTLIALAAASALELALGPQWSGGAIVFAALAMSRMIALFTAAAEPVLGLRERSRELLAISVSTLVMRLLAIVAGMPFGLAGVAVATAIALVLPAVLASLSVAKASGLHVRDLGDLAWRLTANATCLSVLFAACAGGSRLAGLDPAIAITVASTVGLAAYCWSARRMTPEAYGSYRQAAAALTHTWLIGARPG